MFQTKAENVTWQLFSATITQMSHSKEQPN